MIYKCLSNEIWNGPIPFLSILLVSIVLMKSADKNRRRHAFPSQTQVIDERHDEAFEISETPFISPRCPSERLRRSAQTTQDDRLRRDPDSSDILRYDLHGFLSRHRIRVQRLRQRQRPSQSQDKAEPSLAQAGHTARHVKTRDR